MDKRYIISLLAAAAFSPLHAAINSPSTDGYIARAVAMADDHNYNGVIDQLSAIDRTSLPDSQREEVDWLMAKANFALSGAGAKSHFVSFLTIYPYSLHRNEALMHIGDCIFESSYAEALKVYRKVDAGCLSDCQADDLRYRMAYSELQLAEFDEAERLFNRLATTKRYGNAARFYLAYIAYTRHDYNKARSLFEKVNTSEAPGNMADYYLAQIYYLDGDYAKTLSTAQNLLRRNGIAKGFTAEANRLAGEANYQLGNRSEAISYLKKYVSAVETPERSSLYILGISQYENGDYDGTVATLRPVSDAGDAMAQSASLFIGQALLKTGNKDAALLAFDKALKMDIDKNVSEAAYYNYAVAKFSGANIPFGSSVATFEDFLRRYPDSRYAPEVQQYIVEGYMTDRDYDRALASINRMSHPSNKVLAAKQVVLYNLGASALAAGNATTALTYLREADTLSQHNSKIAAEVKLLLGEALYRTGDYKTSAKTLQGYIAKSRKDNENLPLARYDLGYAFFAQKDYPKAAEAFSSVIARPGNLSKAVIADAYNRLGDVSYYESDFSKAASAYDKAFETNPASGDYALFQKALMKGYARDHKGKIADLQRLPDEFPTSTLLADALLETTASYIQLGDNPAAIATYRRLVAQYPNTSQGRQGYLQLALTLLNDGERAEAIDTYREIVKLYPTSDEAREAVDQLKRLSADDGSLNELIAFVNSIEGAPTVDVAEVERLNYEAAEKAYLTDNNLSKLKKYVESYPTGAYRQRALGYLLDDARMNNSADAVGYARQLVTDYPDNSLSEDAYAIVAADLYDKGQTNEALETWRALESRASSSQNLNAARTGIMRAARDLGDYGVVESAADALLASSTIGSEDKNETIFSKALARANNGDNETACELWASIASMTDDLYGAKSAYHLAQNYFDNGHGDRAKKAVEALTNSGTPHSYWLARGFILLSDIYAADGKDFEAREYLNALRENYPGQESDIFMMIDSRLNK